MYVYARSMAYSACLLQTSGVLPRPRAELVVLLPPIAIKRRLVGCYATLNAVMAKEKCAGYGAPSRIGKGNGCPSGAAVKHA